MGIFMGSKFKDTLTGRTDEDMFYGSPENDTLDGGGGIDTVNYRNLSGSSWPGYTLLSGIEASLALGRVKKLFAYYAGGLTKIFTYTDVLLNIENLVGTGLSDTLTGNFGNNMLDGDAGDDTLRGGAGNDTLLGQSGSDVLMGEDGDDSLDGGAGDDQLYGGADSDTLKGKEGNDLLDGGNGNDLLYGYDGADTLKGGGGNDSFWGGAGADMMYGDDGNDILYGETGNDTLAGGTGSDTYNISRGDGVDRVQENDTTAGNTDVLQFAKGVNANQLLFRKTGNNLDIVIMGTADKTVVQDWYLGSAYHVEQIRSGDGKTLQDTQVDKLVQAMAAFAPLVVSQASLTAQQLQQLAPALAGTNWR